MKAIVIGGGLAGCEAAQILTKYGIGVELFEQKPLSYSPAHKYPGLAELVCSNSLKASRLDSASGMLKEEMRLLGSLILPSAEATAVAAGGALAVDRKAFSDRVTEAIRKNPLIHVTEAQVERLGEDPTIVATGPLTCGGLAEEIVRVTGEKGLSFFDAAAPIVDFSSINMDIAFFASRYGKGEASYINCPMTKEQYDVFYDALIHAKEAELKEFDKESQRDLKVFEGCMPVEVMARRGYETLLFGPLKPVGLPLPATGKDAYAVVQLRQDNAAGTMYNIVGFQTHLTFPEQKRGFSLIPGLENAEFMRYGVMHRNTYLQSPGLLRPDYSMIDAPNLFFAGQMTGVEGYVESAASGLVAGINAACAAQDKPRVLFPRECVIGAMASYVSTGGTGAFVPMNANFGIVPPLDTRVKGGKKVRNEALAARSLAAIDAFALTLNQK